MRTEPHPTGHTTAGGVAISSIVVPQPGGTGRVLLTSRHHTHLPTIVAVHGWTATSTLNWGPTAERLGHHYQFVIPDLRGHGQGPDGPFTLDACADDIAAICTRLRRRNVIIAGNSMGGAVAQLVARNHPHLVAGLILCATATHFAEGGGEHAVMAAAGLAARAGEWVTPNRRKRFIELAAARRYSTTSLDVAREVGDHDLLAVLTAGAELGRFDSRPWISTLTAPAAVIVTTGDPVIDTNRQLRLGRAIPGAHIDFVAGGHSACITRPEQFATAFQRAVTHITTPGTARDHPQPDDTDD